MPEASGTIRPATVDDLPRIHEIAVDAWTPIFGRYRLIVGERLWRDVWGGWERNWLRFEPEQWHGRGVVTELEGQVVGFATWAEPTGTLGEVGANAVDSRFLRRGIGSAQVKWVVDMFRSRGLPAAKVHTGMDPAHGPARAAYRKAGLRVGVYCSQYLNELDEVARLPIPKGLRFRYAKADDADAVSAIARAAWEPIYDAVRQRLGQPLFDWAFPNVLERRVEEFADAVRRAPDAARIVEAGGEPAGFALLSEEPEKKIGGIRALGVAPAAQGRGVGAALCMDAFDVFRSRGLLYARLTARLGEVTWPARQLAWNVGLYRELPSIDYYMTL